MTDPERALLREGEHVLFIDGKDRQYLRQLRAGVRVHIRDGTISCDEVIGSSEAGIVRNSAGEPFLFYRPSYAELIPNLPRQAQVIYPKDIGPILLWGDIHPGARVVEIGVGPGATTIALLRAVGTSGEVITYELREEFATLARQNVRKFYGDSPNWKIRIGNANDGLFERDIDRMIVDLAEPWEILAHARQALRPGGILVGYVPTVLQVKNLVDRAREGGFGAVQVIEPFLRGWHVRGMSIRPEHRMVAHTGFLVIARRLADRANESLIGKDSRLETMVSNGCIDDEIDPGFVEPDDDDLR